MRNICGICKSNIVQIQFTFSPLILDYASDTKQQLLSLGNSSLVSHRRMPE